MQLPNSADFSVVGIAAFVSLAAALAWQALATAAGDRVWRARARRAWLLIVPLGLVCGALTVEFFATR